LQRDRRHRQAAWGVAVAQPHDVEEHLFFGGGLHHLVEAQPPLLEVAERRVATGEDEHGRRERGAARLHPQTLTSAPTLVRPLARSFARASRNSDRRPALATV